MKGIDWKRKLSSRKFWTAVTGFVVAILFAFNIADVTVEKVTSIISATAILIAYILAEGFVDSKNDNSKEE
ncbi:hypothetical protein JZO72_13040 [Vagococcus fluvialis]|uniref:hypothetical protein n=1 Tax=Vagococcus fluvialis TaxID=2738 RepID=UPI001A901279|nr:hypothetical protein [Vagococcus fluvialis]MBO0480554.1 hypothetical protein [Vagococcus fluvialis]MBO0485787.1 hypothetical protein [Vagococcus fluvialis]